MGAVASSSTRDWEELFDRADDCVQETIKMLPENVKQEAETVPCILKKWPSSRGKHRLLGIFRNFTPGVTSESKGPIELYLGNIADLCEEDKISFEDEVRQTYLHELGHHLGLDEGDLDRLGL